MLNVEGLKAKTQSSSVEACHRSGRFEREIFGPLPLSDDIQLQPHNIRLGGRLLTRKEPQKAASMVAKRRHDTLLRAIAHAAEVQAQLLASSRG